jgi:hypothetical protein
MERLTLGTQGTAPFHHRLREGILRSVWAIRQYIVALTRSFGVWNGGLLATLFLATGALIALDHQQKLEEMWKLRYATAQVSRPPDKTNEASTPDDGRQRLIAFEHMLLPHQDIPLALQDLLRLAEDDGLVIQRAEYRAQVDIRGRFMRYRINLPVQGTAETVNRYIYTALLQQKNLALESVQLKRDALDSPDLEARIQWVLLTSLPPSRPGVSP